MEHAFHSGRNWLRLLVLLYPLTIFLWLIQWFWLLSNVANAEITELALAVAAMLVLPLAFESQKRRIRWGHKWVQQFPKWQRLIVYLIVITSLFVAWMPPTVFGTYLMLGVISGFLGEEAEQETIQQSKRLYERFRLFVYWIGILTFIALFPYPSMLTKWIDPSGPYHWLVVRLLVYGWLIVVPILYTLRFREKMKRFNAVQE